MIKISNLNFDYGSDDSTVFKRVNLEFAPGELSLIIGPTGSGKSTLLSLLNRLSPSFTGGRFSGDILVDGHEITQSKPKDLASLIGYVNQTPETSFVAETVIEELAFGMEQLGFPVSTMTSKIDEICLLLDLTHLQHSSLENLSAGQQQRVAIGAALVSGQRVLLLDEPTSALDSESATKLLGTLNNLKKSLGITVILTEHRIENLVEIADSLVILKGDGSALKKESTWEAVYSTFPDWQPSAPLAPATTPAPLASKPLMRVHNFCLRHPGANANAVANANLELSQGEIVTLYGPNGSGKTTLLEGLCGLIKVVDGQVSILGQDVTGMKPVKIAKHISLVPQNASDLLFLNTVGAELKESDSLAGVPDNTTSKIFANLVGRANPAIHPRDLSVGQQLALVISIQLAIGAPLIALDEPTRGLDYEAKAQLAQQLFKVRDSGKSVILATHDLAFANQVADKKYSLHAGVLTPEHQAK